MTKIQSAHTVIQEKATFTRDRLTWLSYAMLAYFSYLQASPGSLLPFIRTELHLDYEMTAWHFSAFGVGMLLAGLVADQLTQRLGRTRVFWGGAIGMALGSLSVIMGDRPWITLTGILVMGILGTLLLISIQSVLADRHGERQGMALAEANIGASFGAGFSAFCVGGFARTILGWRGALILPVLALIVLYVYGGRENLILKPQRTGMITPVTRQKTTRGRLPFIFWVNWLIVVLVVSSEWCMTFWAASFLQSKLHIDAGSAATLLALYLLTTIAGRFIGSWLMRLATGPLLLFFALGTALSGFLLFWLAAAPLFVVAGLLVTGVGIANLWPQAITRAFAAAPQQSDQASARVSFAAGLAICAAPLLVGTLANMTNLATAYATVPCLLITALAVSIIARAIPMKRQKGESYR